MESSTLSGWLLPRSYRHAFLLAGIAGFAILVLFGDGRLDLAWERVYFNALSGDFPLHTSRWVQRVLYQNGKTLVIVLDLATLAAIAATALARGIPARAATAAAIGVLAIPAAVALLKRFSATPCPWDVIEFGGVLEHLPLLNTTAAQAAGHCMPAGHPSAGFAPLGLVLPLAVAGRYGYARLATMTGLLLGAVMGWLRMLQGAHFFSHVLWTLWVAALVCLLVARLFGLPWPLQAPPR